MVRWGMSVLLGIVTAALTGASYHPPDTSTARPHRWALAGTRHPAVLHARCLSADRAETAAAHHPGSAGRSGTAATAHGSPAGSETAAGRMVARDHPGASGSGAAAGRDLGAAGGSGTAASRDQGAPGRSETAASRDHGSAARGESAPGRDHGTVGTVGRSNAAAGRDNDSAVRGESTPGRDHRTVGTAGTVGRSVAAAGRDQGSTGRSEAAAGRGHGGALWSGTAAGHGGGVGRGGDATARVVSRGGDATARAVSRGGDATARGVGRGGDATARVVARDEGGAGRGEVQRLMGALRAGLRRRYGVANEARVPQTPIVVPVRFHVITAGEQGRLSREAVQTQIDTLNAAYGGGTGGANTGVSFRLTGDPDYTDNALWFSHPRDFERSMKTPLHRGGAGTLNLYTAGSGPMVLGFSTFPQAYRKDPVLDGVVVDYRSLPGGQYQHFDKGYTAVHEVGHWLGLFHTFENGCVPPGDAVDDTPYEAVPTQGCPWFKDTCPAPGDDPVHNFMDYGYDDCMTEFTPGQAKRIHAVWTVFRQSSSGRHFRHT